MARKAAKKKRGRPKGTKTFSGVLRFAVTAQMMQRVETFRKEHGLPSISDAARRAMDRGLDAT